MQMQSVDAAGKVARRLHNKMMGKRYIEIFEVSSAIACGTISPCHLLCQCTGDEVATALAEGSSRGYRGGGGGGGGYRRGGGGGRQRYNSGSGAIVKARGLPYSTTDSELADFFEEYDVRPVTVYSCFIEYYMHAYFTEMCMSISTTVLYISHIQSNAQLCLLSGCIIAM